MDSSAPAGLSLSLDALIKKNSKARGGRTGAAGGDSRGGRGGRHSGVHGRVAQIGTQGRQQWQADNSMGNERGQVPSGRFQEALRPIRSIGKPSNRASEHRIGVPIHSDGYRGNAGSGTGRGAGTRGGRSQRGESAARAGRGGGRGGRMRNDLLAYKREQSCYVEETTGEVVVRFHKTDIVRVNVSGDVKLTSGGFHTITTLQSLNDALAPIHMEVSAATEGPPGEVAWAVRDGRSLTRFTDDMVLYAKGPQSQTRGAMILQAYLKPDAAAATAASNSQAVAEGLLSAHVGGIAGMRRAPTMYRGDAPGGGLDDSSLGLYEGNLGSRAQLNNRARYSRTFTNTSGGDVFSRLGGEGVGGGVTYGGGGGAGGGAEQMNMDDMHIRY